jgi:serine/threonine protein phosphatase PrpC
VLRVSEHFHKTDTGRQRKSNEDNLFARPPVFAVADGMGGARAGEVASRMVREALEAGLPDDGSAEERLAERARQANRAIHDLALANPAQAGMGTTLTAAYVGEDAVSLAHVGDSRAYRLRDGRLELLTRDHSLVGELVRRGKLTEQEAEEHPQRSVITRALGPEPDVEVDTWSYPAQAGDVFLLCSDGLTSMVDEAHITQLVRDHGDLAQAGQALIEEANQRGGRDNITVVLFRLEDVSGPATAAPAPAGTDSPTQTDLEPVTAEQAREAVAGDSGTAMAPASAAAVAAAAAGRTTPPRRTAPLPARQPEPAPEPPRRRRRIRGLRPALVTIVVAAAILTGAWIATRAVYFVGAEREGFVTVYRGLPYEGPIGLRLYERMYVSAVPISELPAARRRALLDHRLRSREDAQDLVRKLELGQVDA